MSLLPSPLRSPAAGIGRASWRGRARMSGGRLASRRRNTIFACDWSSDVCSSDLIEPQLLRRAAARGARQRPAGVAAVRFDLEQEVPFRVPGVHVAFEVVGDDVHFTVALQVAGGGDRKSVVEGKSADVRRSPGKQKTEYDFCL